MGRGVTWNHRYEWFQLYGGGLIAHEVGAIVLFGHEGARFVELVPGCEYRHHRVSFEAPNMRAADLEAPCFPLVFCVLESRPIRHRCPKCFCDPPGRKPTREEIEADVQRRIARYVARREKAFYADVWGEDAARFAAEAAVLDYDESDDRPNPIQVRVTEFQHRVLEELRTARNMRRDPMSRADVVERIRRIRRTNCEGAVTRALDALLRRQLIAQIGEPRTGERPFVAVY